MTVIASLFHSLLTSCMLPAQGSLSNRSTHPINHIMAVKTPLTIEHVW